MTKDLRRTGGTVGKRRRRERRLAAERKRVRGELCNRVLQQGSIVHAVDLACRSLQRHFGRSVKVRAAGMMVARLARTAESAGRASQSRGEAAHG
jgi:hypothetical protein